MRYFVKENEMNLGAMVRKVPRAIRIGLLCVLILAIPYSITHIISACYYAVTPYFVHKNKPSIYQPIVADIDMISNYAPRAKEAMDGKIIVSDVCFPKYKDGPLFLPLINPIVFGTFAKLLDFPGQNLYGLVNARIITDIIFSFLILLIFYFVYSFILEGWLLPVLMLCLSIVKLHFFAKFIGDPTPSGIFNSSSYLFRWENHDIVSDLLRWEGPILTFIFFGLFFLTGVHAVKTAKLRNFALWAFFTGMLSYVYLYQFLYASIAFFLVITYLTVKREITIRNTIITFSIYVLVIMFYLYNVFMLINFENYLDLKRRIGFEEGRFLRWGLWPTYLFHFFIIGIIVRFYRKARDVVEKRLLILAACFLITNLVALNLQMITGFIPHPDHWFRYAIGQPFGIVLAIIISCLVKFIKSSRISFLKSQLVKTARISVYMLIIWFSFSHYISAFVYASKCCRWYQFPYEYVYAMNVINEYAQAEDVVLSINNRINYSLLSYTSTNPYFLDGVITLASHEEIVNRFLYGSFIFGVPPEEVSKVLTTRRMNFYLFSNYYMTNKPGWRVINKDLSANWTYIIPDRERNILVERYKNLNFDMEDVLTNDIDFIIESPDDYYKSKFLSKNINKYYELIDDNNNGWRVWRFKYYYRSDSGKTWPYAVPSRMER
jgi:hypothetical protein